MEKGALIIQYQIDGDLVSKEEFEKRRKSKSGEKSNAAVSKEKSKFKKHGKIKNLKNNDVALFKEKSKTNAVEGVSKDKGKQVDVVQAQQQERTTTRNGVEISYMKNGKLVSKEDFKDDNKIEEHAQDNSVDDHQKIKDPKQVLLEKKIADLEKELCSKDKQNETLEHHLYIQLKENKAVQVKLEQAQVLNDSLKETIHQMDLKIKALDKNVETFRNTKLAFKKKVKELRRTITVQKEQLNSKDSTISRLSKKLIEVQASEEDVSHPLKDVLMVKDETTKMVDSSRPVKDNSNVNKDVKSLKNLDLKIQDQDNRTQEVNCEIVRCDTARVCKCETARLHNDSRLNSIEMAVNLLKDQFCIQNNELAQLRDFYFASNNAGK